MKDHINAYRQTVRAVLEGFRPNSGEVFRDQDRLSRPDDDDEPNDQYLTTVRRHIGAFSLDMDIWMRDIVVGCIGHGILVDKITLLDRPSADGSGYMAARLNGADQDALHVMMNDLCERSTPPDPERVLLEGSCNQFLGSGRPLSYKFAMNYNALMEKPAPLVVHRLAQAGILSVVSPRPISIDTLKGAALACGRQLLGFQVLLNADQATEAFPELRDISGWTGFRSTHLVFERHIHETMQHLFEVFGDAPAVAPCPDDNPENEPALR